MAVMLLLINGAVNKGAPESLVLFYVFAGGALCSFFYLLTQKTSFLVPPDTLLLIVCAPIASFIANFWYFKGMHLAPNAGYAAAIEGCKALLVTIAAIWLFKGSSLSCQKVLGVLCCVIGVALISLPKLSWPIK
jgi:drug/metabolite transporter (DMT)-like permease